ncbi:hypothetical protein [Aquibium microcysteis]|uniref:hypothetical protein n=1 Tax=Aquibium microcysteis TaxID=675281 RepID=UPI00165D1C1C|nr:hypothetical protein [Aquibium microcysteis]
MADIKKTPDGLVAKTRANLTALIDRYVPRFTQEDVWEMVRLHEERVFDLLVTIHEYRERNQQMAERMDGMEKEYYSQVRIPVSLGTFASKATLDPAEMMKTYSVRWALDRYEMHYRIPEWEVSRLSPKETPHLFEMVGRQFEEQAKRELLPKLRAEYLKLYDHFRI